jgi:hypothetical protein
MSTSNLLFKSVGANYIVIDEVNERRGIVKLTKPPKNQIHEIIISIRQNNLDYIEKLLNERSSPDHVQYQQWLSYDEISKLTINLEGQSLITNWFDEYAKSKQLPKLSYTQYNHYIKAVAPIHVWDELLHTNFYEWKNTVTNISYYRSTSYSLPIHLKAHISSIFNVCEFPPTVKKHSHKPPNIPNNHKDVYKTTMFTSNNKNTFEFQHSYKQRVPNDMKLQGTLSTVTVPFLNKYYKIPSNIGTWI